MKITGITTQIVVADVIKTTEYYRDFLGFEIIDYFLNPPIYSMIQRDGIQIHFGKADDDKNVQKSTLSLRKSGFDIYLWVTEIEELFKELIDKKVTILEPLTNRIYGNYEFSILDCNGMKIVFGEK